MLTCDTCALKQKHLGCGAVTPRDCSAGLFQAQEQPVEGDNILDLETFLEALLKCHLIGDHLIRVTR